MSKPVHFAYDLVSYSWMILGGIFAMSASTFAGGVTMILGAFSVAFALAIPRMMPGVRMIFAAWLDYCTERDKRSMACEIEKHEMQVRMQLQTEEKLKGTLIWKVEEMDRKLVAAEESREDLMNQLKSALKQREESDLRNADLMQYLIRGVDVNSREIKKVSVKVDGSHRIMVVEDDADACKLICRSLELKGYEAVCAATIADARMKFTGRCLWIFVDVRLPDGSGLDYLKEIKDRNSNIKVAMMTGLGPDTLAEADRLMADACFPKPIDMDDVFATMQKLEHSAPRPTIQDFKAALSRSGTHYSPAALPGP